MDRFWSLTLEGDTLDTTFSWCAIYLAYLDLLILNARLLNTDADSGVSAVRENLNSDTLAILMNLQEGIVYFLENRDYLAALEAAHRVFYTDAQNEYNLNNQMHSVEYLVLLASCIRLLFISKKYFVEYLVRQ